MTDYQTTVSCLNCNSTGWLPHKGSYAQCEICKELRQADNRVRLARGEYSGILMGLDGSIKLTRTVGGVTTIWAYLPALEKAS